MPVIKVDNLPILSLFFSILLLVALPVAGYTDTGFVMGVALSQDKITVTEQVSFSLDSDQERQAFAASLQLGRSTVSDWSRYSSNIDYHFVGSVVNFDSIEITAKRDFTSVFPTGVVIIQYEVDSAVLIVEKPSSRVTRYILDTKKLDLPRLPSGEIVLGSGTKLSFEIPASASFNRASPAPDIESDQKVTFQGPLASHIFISFDEEKTLSEEVNEFFTQTTSNTASLIPILLALAVVAFLGYKLVTGKR